MGVGNGSVFSESGVELRCRPESVGVDGSEYAIKMLESWVPIMFVFANKSTPSNDLRDGGSTTEGTLVLPSCCISRWRRTTRRKAKEELTRVTRGIGGRWGTCTSCVAAVVGLPLLTPRISGQRPTRTYGTSGWPWSLPTRKAKEQLARVTLIDWVVRLVMTTMMNKIMAEENV